MFLNLGNESGSMKLVYQLLEELKENPQRAVMTQALTLNKSKPMMGLKGTHGLFASDEWWENIKYGVMPTLHISGVIQRAYISGQEPSGLSNTVDLLLDDGSISSAGIYVNDDKDVSLFKKGARAEILYALDELKSQPAPDGSVNYSKVALEMAVSK